MIEINYKTGKKIFFCLLLLVLNACTSYIPVSITDSFNKSANVKIAVLSTNVFGNPDIKKDHLLSDRYALEFKQMGFQVTDRVFVDSWLVDNNIDRDSEISTSTMKLIQEDLNVDAILSTSVTYVYVPEKETSTAPAPKSSDTNVEVNVDNNNGNSRSRINTSDYGKYKGVDWNAVNNPTAKSSKIGAYYRKDIESLKLIDAINSEILIEASTNLKIYDKTKKILESIKFNLDNISEN